MSDADAPVPSLDALVDLETLALRALLAVWSSPAARLHVVAARQVAYHQARLATLAALRDEPRLMALSGEQELLAQDLSRTIADLEALRRRVAELERRSC